jgi:hypothetical protein
MGFGWMRLLAIGFLCAAFFACRGDKPDGEEQQNGNDTEAPAPEPVDVTEPEQPAPAAVDPGTYSPSEIDQPGIGGDVTPNPTLCRDEMCWKLSGKNEKVISHVLVSLPCPELIEEVWVTDLAAGTKCGSLPPSDGDDDGDDGAHDLCGLTGLRLEDIETNAVELCIRTSQPVSPNAVTIALKAGGECSTVQTATEEQCGCQ